MLDIIYYKVQGESFLSLEIKLLNLWHMTHDMTKREIWIIFKFRNKTFEFVAYDTWYDKERDWKNFCYIQERWKLAITEKKNMYECISLVYVWATKVKWWDWYKLLIFQTLSGSQKSQSSQKDPWNNVVDIVFWHCHHHLSSLKV